MTASTGEHRERANAADQPEQDKAIPADTFAARLVLARHFAGRLSIEKAAERCDLSPGNWAHWEDGRKPRDRVEVAGAVSDGLGIDFNWLLLGGPLTPARGRPVTKRSGSDSSSYARAAVRTHPVNVRPAPDRPRVPTHPRSSLGTLSAGRRAAPVR